LENEPGGKEERKEGKPREKKGRLKMDQKYLRRWAWIIFLLPTPLRIKRKRSSDQSPIPLTISGSPRSLGLFLKKLRPAVWEGQN